LLAGLKCGGIRTISSLCAQDDRESGAGCRKDLFMQANAITRAALPPAVLDANNRTGKYLIFHLGDEEFGTEVLKVREIMGLQDITTVPQTPAFVKGVINLRGKVIPVVDLRLKFGFPAQEYTPRTCIIVIRTTQADQDLMIGIIVDGVAEVLNLTEAEIEDTPDFGAGVATPFLKGMAKIKGKVKILLDIDRVLSAAEIGGIESMLQ
jgi:purine-binding chemotaxis protein CheW